MSRRNRIIPDRLTTAPPNGTTPRPRFIGRQGEPRIRVIGRRETRGADLYHQALQLSWLQFLLLGAGLFLALNAVFAILYALQPRGITDLAPGSVLEAFFFSVQTLATIGLSLIHI